MEYSEIKLHEILRKLRKEHGFNQTQLSEMVGLKRSTYAYYELGKTTPDIFVLIKIAKAYGITLDELLGCFDRTKRIAAEESKYSISVNRLSIEEKELLVHFRLMDDNKQAKLLEYAKSNCEYEIKQK